MTLLYTLISVTVVSLASFVGIVSLTLPVVRLQKLMVALIGFAAGTLLGDTFLHVIPELNREGWNITISLSLLGAIVLFFVLEHFIRWHHAHHVSPEERHPVGFLNLVGDGLHNFIDGFVIGASYLIDAPLGLATTLAVIFHELPQELGDFAILIHSGFSKRQAFLFNFLSALLAVIGGIFAVWIGSELEGFRSIMLAFTAGGFIYIATVDLIPELHKEVNLTRSAVQLLSLLLGLGLMVLLLLLE